MYGVFRTIDLPPPHRPPALGAGGRTHSLGGEGVGVNSSEDARYCSVFYICKYNVDNSRAHQISANSVTSGLVQYNVSTAALSAFTAHQYVFYGIN
jgi:hypothetical protein